MFNLSIFNCLFVLIFVISSKCFASILDFDYSFIKDIKNPTYRELKLLQRKLRSINRRIGLKPFLKEYTDNCCNINFIDAKGKRSIKHERFCINTDENDLDRAIITFASFNKNYPRGLERLNNLIKNSSYKGHLISRLGGWPNINSGELKYAHIPYSFKVCFFNEVANIGYKKILWIDASVVPIVNLNSVFDQIEHDGYIVLDNWHNIGPYDNELSLNEYEISMDDAMSIRSCEVSVVGFDLSSKLGTLLFEDWYSYMKKPYGYFSSRPEQNALSIIFYKNNISNFIPLSKIATSLEQVNQHTSFVVDRSYVH